MSPSRSRSSEEILEFHADGVAGALAEAVHCGENIATICALVLERESPIFQDAFVQFDEDPGDESAIYGIMERSEANEMFTVLGKPEVAEAIGEPRERGDVPLIVCCAETVLVASASVAPAVTAPGSKGVLS